MRGNSTPMAVGVVSNVSGSLLAGALIALLSLTGKIPKVQGLATDPPATLLEKGAFRATSARFSMPTNERDVS